MEYMEENMVTMFIHALDERLPKSNIVTKWTHENKSSVHDELPSIYKHMPWGLTRILEFIMDGFLTYPLSQGWIKEIWCNKCHYIGETNREILWIK